MRYYTLFRLNEPDVERSVYVFVPEFSVTAFDGASAVALVIYLHVVPVRSDDGSGADIIEVVGIAEHPLTGGDQLRGVSGPVHFTVADFLGFHISGVSFITSFQQIGIVVDVANNLYLFRIIVFNGAIQRPIAFSCRMVDIYNIIAITSNATFYPSDNPPF